MTLQICYLAVPRVFRTSILYPCPLPNEQSLIATHRRQWAPQWPTAELSPGFGFRFGFSRRRTGNYNVQQILCAKVPRLRHQSLTFLCFIFELARKAFPLACQRQTLSFKVLNAAPCCVGRRLQQLTRLICYAASIIHCEEKNNDTKQILLQFPVGLTALEKENGYPATSCEN